MYVLIEGDLIVLLVIYIDDVLITSSHMTKISTLIDALCSKFKMTMLGRLALYLGVQFLYTSTGVLMSHERYVQKCLHNLGLQECYGVSVPLDPATKLSSGMGAPLVDPTYYRIIVGKLLHLQTTRLDICFAVGLVSRFMAAPQ